MCAIFGFVNYRHAVSKKHLKELVNRLAVASEVRGTDAAGIAYVKDGEMKIFKKPKPAHKMRFYFPGGTTMVTGHTRMATQGKAKYNCNNHPFKGETADGVFALCHNGVLYNDDVLAKTENLPKTNIQTDSYIAVQLIEKYGHLNFDTIAQMSEKVHGSFVFTMLNEDNTLYISKGDNPLCLVHFKKLGLYVYISTPEIMAQVIKGSFLENYKYKELKVSEGEIIRIDKSGVLTRDTFTTENENYFYDYYARYRTACDETDGYLFSVCNMFGISPEDLSLLYEMGYSDEEIEMMMDDKSLLKSCIEEAKECVGVYI